MFCKPREKNAPGLASFERARPMIGALPKILTDLLVCLGHILFLHLGLLFPAPRELLLEFLHTILYDADV
jgi:hypothetical protein